MPADVIVLNGGSSSGKSTLAPHIQRGLPGIWLVLGVDDLIRALSYGPTDTSAGGSLGFRHDGSITVSDKFRQAEAAWWNGMAAIAAAGVGVILDEVLLEGGKSQRRLSAVIKDLDAVWVGVRCEPDVVEARERRRGDRVHGQARNQALRVHEGVRYDVVVDTTTRGPDECAVDIIQYVASHFP
ncbi:MAG: AAA family ATPase [Acidimicrobiales bacterium]|nr:AAA family ATPase [Acidimicrobiales bacterium]